MKIDANNKPIPLRNLDSSSAEVRVKTETPEPAVQAAAGDTVNLSDRSKLIAKARDLVAQAPEIRAEKVADLTARIAAGTYKVSGQDVAKSIIRKSISEIV